MKKNALYWFLSGFSILILLGAKITTETLNIGNKTAEDIKIVFDIGQGASNPMVRWANSAGKIQFSNDGTNFFDMGSGEGGGSGINVVENGGFESGVTGWTASGSSAVAEVSAAANVAKGSKSASWDATATTETLKSDIQLIPNALNGKACLASALYKWPTGTVGHIVARVEDNGTAVTADLDLVPTDGSDWFPIQIAFTCVDGQQLSFVLEATADADILYLDEVHVGSDYRVGEGIITETVSAAALATNTNGSVGSDTDSGQSITLQAGTWRIFSRMVVGANTCTGTGAGNYGYSVGRLTTAANSDVLYMEAGLCNANAPNQNGTHVLDTVVTITAPTTYKTRFGCYTNGTGGVGTCLLQGGGAGSTRSPYLYAQKIQQSSAVTLETQGWFIDARVTDTVTGYSSLAAGDNVLANADANLLVKSGSAAAKIPCAAPNPPTGTNCAVGNENVGVSFDAPYSGWFKICADVTTYYGGIGPAENFQTQYYWRRTSTTSATALDATERTVTSRVDELNAASVIYMNDSICQNWNLQAGNHVFRLAYVYSLTGAVTSRHMLGTDLGTRITVTPITQNFPQAVAISHVPTGGTSAGCPNGENICSGSWTPTALATVDWSAVSINTGYYARVGNVVTGSARFVATSLDTTYHILELTLPIATSTPSTMRGSGSCFYGSASTVDAHIPLNVQNNAGIYTTTSPGGGARSYTCEMTFQYVVN